MHVCGDGNDALLQGASHAHPLQLVGDRQPHNIYSLNCVWACLPNVGMFTWYPKCYVILYWGWLPSVNHFRNVSGSLAVPSCTSGVCDDRCHFVKIALDLHRLRKWVVPGWTILTFHVCSCTCLAGTYDSNSPYYSLERVRCARHWGIYCPRLNGALAQRCVVPPQSLSLYRHYCALRTLGRHGVAGSSFPPISINYHSLDPREWQWCWCQYACCIGAQSHQPVMCALRARCAVHCAH